MLDFFNSLIADLRPSSYKWLFVKIYDLAVLDDLADNRKFPILFDLTPAIYYAILLSVIRLVLNFVITKVLGECHSLQTPLLLIDCF